MEIISKYFCVDIETRHAPEEDILKAQAKIEKGEISSRLKNPEIIEEATMKVEEAYAKALQKVRDDSALLNAAPIGCIGLSVDNTKILNYSTFTLTPEERTKLMKEGIEPFTHKDEGEMMDAFVQELDRRSDDWTGMVGFNSTRFDFAKIRLACRRNGVKIPHVLRFENRKHQIDLMWDFINFYNCEKAHKKFISLKAVCEEFKIPYRKSLDGAEIPNAIANGDHYTVAFDCSSDVLETYQCYRKIHG